MPRRADAFLDELAELVADRLERRRETADERPKRATVAPKWTERLAATLRELKAEQLASRQDADVARDQSNA